VAVPCRPALPLNALKGWRIRPCFNRAIETDYDRVAKQKRSRYHHSEQLVMCVGHCRLERLESGETVQDTRNAKYR